MNKTTLTNYSPIALTRNQISKLLDQLIVCERNTKEERKLLLPEWEEAEDFTVLDEMEMLTTDIRGYASQVQISGRIKNEDEAIQTLENLHIFEKKSVANWYFNTDEGDYLQIKLYLSLLDYLRFLVLKYLKLRRIEE